MRNPALKTDISDLWKVLWQRLPVFSTMVLLAATACIKDATGLPVKLPSPEYTPSITVQTSSIKGFLEFPFISADAGNFSLQAGERISISWIDAPSDADKYELVLLNSDGVIKQIIPLSDHSGADVQTTWLVPPEQSGILEARAYFPDGHVVRSGCFTHVYTNKLPPEGICSLRTVGMAPQHLYAERDPESDRIIGIAPGLYLEVLARSTDGWYLVRTLPDIQSEAQNNQSTTGWLHASGELRLFGSCEGLPLESGPGDHQ
jgi:hypothetical protein